MNHLERAKEYLRIAESADSKKEAYRAAAEEIAAYRKESGESLREIAVKLQLDKSYEFIRLLLKWRDSGYKADTPWLQDEKATTRAAVSHTRQVLRTADPEQLKQILSDLPDTAVRSIGEVAQGITDEQFEDVNRRVREKDAAHRKANPMMATSRVGVRIGNVSVAVQMLAREYQDFLALVTGDDEDSDLARESTKERLVNLRAEVDLALSEIIDGSIDNALQRLLEGEGSTA